MNGINLKKIRVESRIHAGNLTAMGIAVLLLTIVYAVSRYWHYDEILQEKANKAFIQLHDLAERAINTHELDAITHKVGLIVDQETVKYIQLFERGKTAPLWTYKDFENTSSTKVFEFDIIDSMYPAYGNVVEYQTDSLGLKERKIGLMRVAVAEGAIQRKELLNGMLLLSAIIIVSSIASFVGMWINRCNISTPINEILEAVLRLEKGALETPVYQSAWGEIGKIQAKLEHVRQKLLDSAKCQREYWQSQIESQYNMEVLSRANNQFISSVANQTISFLNVIRGELRNITKKVILIDPMEKQMLIAAEEGLEDLAERIDELATAARYSVADIKLNCEPIGVAGLLDSIVNGCDVLARRKGIHLSYALYPVKAKEHSIVFCDADKVRYAIGALLNYIINRSANGSVVLESTLQSIACGERWCLKITETSGVINENEIEARALAAQPLNRESMNASIAMLLIERMGGSIKITANRGRATVIELMLPSGKETFNGVSHAVT